MIGLALAELRAHAASFAGLALLAAGAAFALALGLSLVETGRFHGGEYAENLAGAASLVLIFTTVCAVGVLGAVANLAIVLARRRYALWQLAGASPAQVGTVVLVQFLLTVSAGALAGALLAIPVVRPVFAYVFAGSAVMEGIVPRLGGFSVGGSVAAVLVLSAAGSLRAIRAAAATPQLAILREPEPRGAAGRPLRWLAVLATGAGAMAASGSLKGSAPDGAALSLAILVVPANTLFLVALAPAVYPPLLRLWTALLPARVSPAWYLARHQARFRLSHGTAAITPVLVGAALAGGLFSTAATLNTALAAVGRPTGTLRVNEVLLLLGGPGLIAVIGSAAVVFMANRSAGRGLGLLHAAGAGPGTLLGSMLCQGLIYVVTAALGAGLVVLASVLVIASSLAGAAPGTRPVLEPVPALVVLGAGTVVLLVATLIPALPGLRGDRWVARVRR